MISIVMPTLDEASNLPLRAREIARQRGPWEWIVADGGSSDATPAIARACGARVVTGPRGRGAQLNAGAAIADGDILLFLHADTALPDGALDAIRAALACERVAAGNFTFRFDRGGLSGAIFAASYALAQRWFGIAFGDSAIWVRRTTFARAGGFRDDPVLEDHRFVQALKAGGTRLVRLPLAVRTSPRRYRGRPLRTLARWLLILALHAAGVPPARLAALYPPHRATPRRETVTTASRRRARA